MHPQAKQEPFSPKGFVEGSPEKGMSGGAVVDMRCGLWGITRAKSLWGVGGAFVRLTPEVAALLQAAALEFPAGSV
jgi:hypothetical protein